VVGAKGSSSRRMRHYAQYGSRVTISWKHNAWRKGQGDRIIMLL
jgi:hypothetical protein